jgi:imidazolonepropionase-like amidohydrolase
MSFFWSHAACGGIFPVMSGILIEGGRVIDGAANPPFDADVFVEGGAIRAVGREAAALAAQSTAVARIDARGRTVMPGLIDAHCHVSFDEPQSNDELFFHRRAGLAAIVAARNVRRLLRAGVTGFFDADSIFELGIDLRDAIESGVIHGPRMATGGYALLTSVGGTAGRLLPDEGGVGYARIVRTRDEIVREVRRQIKMGVDWIKVHVTGLVPRQRDTGEIQAWSFDELRAVCDTAHELGIPVVGHCRGARSTRDAARAGFDLILHATYMDEEAFSAVVERKVPIAPTFTFQANLADYGEAVGASADLREVFRREIEESAAQLRQAYDAGVPLLCGTESGFSLTPYGEWHYRELEVFVRDIGLSPLEAIECGTRAGARVFGLDGRLGTVAAGQLADLIVVDGDPSKDVTVLGVPGAVRYVLVGGREVPLEDLDPPRAAIPGWRVSEYSRKVLDRAEAKRGSR